jgi:hypothetical protein
MNSYVSDLFRRVAHSGWRRVNRNRKFIVKDHSTSRIRAPFHSLWRAWFLHIFALAKADNNSLHVASLRKLVEGLRLTPNNAPPSHNPAMRNKTWQLAVLSRTMKKIANWYHYLHLQWS